MRKKYWIEIQHLKWTNNENLTFFVVFLQSDQCVFLLLTALIVSIITFHLLVSSAENIWKQFGSPVWFLIPLTGNLCPDQAWQKFVSDLVPHCLILWWYSSKNFLFKISRPQNTCKISQHSKPWRSKRSNVITFTLKARLQQTTNVATFSPIFDKNKVWYYMRIVCQQTILMKYALLVIFEKAEKKNWNCCLLQIIGGTLRVHCYYMPSYLVTMSYLNMTVKAHYSGSDLFISWLIFWVLTIIGKLGSLSDYWVPTTDNDNLQALFWMLGFCIWFCCLLALYLGWMHRPIFYGLLGNFACWIVLSRWVKCIIAVWVMIRCTQKSSINSAALKQKRVNVSCHR